MKHIYFFALFSLLLSACQKEELQPVQQVLTIGSSYNLNSIMRYGTDTLLVAAGNVFADGGAIYESHDAGATWQTSRTLSQAALKLYSNNNGDIFCSTFGNEMQHKKNSAWAAQFLLGWETWRGVAFNSSGKGVLVGGRNFGEGYIQIIDNQDSIGERLFFGHELYDACFVDEQIAIAVGYGIVLRSTDAGNTWTVADIRGDFYQAVHFATPQIGYIVGKYGSILKTEDAGATWKKLRRASTVGNEKHRYSDVFFESENIGWIAGENGTLLLTRNGGKDWQRIATDENSAWNSIAVTNNYLFLVGDDAKLLRLERDNW
jgi:photosystem II stability/assembly factor-like uncharacterized protein